LSENGLGYNLGDFFTNASGHPDGTVDQQNFIPANKNRTTLFSIK
jgi:hypothetical protein